MPTEPPNIPLHRRWSFLLASVIAVAAVAALIGWQGLRDMEPSAATSTTVPPTTQAPPPTTEPPPSIGPTSKPYDVLWEERNSRASTVRSQAFKAPSAWRIEWAVDCSNFKAHDGGNFKITGDGDFQQIQIEATEVYATGRKPLNRGGFGHLYVETVCERWTVRALSG